MQTRQSLGDIPNSKRYTPGPGNYEITQDPALPKPYPHINGSGFNSICDRGITKYPENKVPGPGTYVENHKCIGEMEDEDRIGSPEFGSKSNRFHGGMFEVPKTNVTPGPDQYQFIEDENYLKMVEHENAVFTSTVDRFPRKKIVKQSIYDLPPQQEPPIHQRKRQIKYTSKRFIPKKRIQDFPGPGQYDQRPKSAKAPVSIFKSKSSRFNKLSTPGLSFEAPGPGEYECSKFSPKATFNVTANI